MSTNATSPLFRSFFQGGFECSSHRRPDGERLDLLTATGHDRFASEDYRSLAAYGIRTVRDGLRWHRIETAPGHYDWSSFLPLLRASHRAGMQVIWDLCHYGWPDDLDIWSAAFVDRFARFVEAAARVVRNEADEVPFYCPVNEISFLSWAGGDVAYFNPGTRGRGGELKRQLVRAAIAATEAVRAVDPRARFVQAEPIIHVAPLPNGRYRRRAEEYRCSQFEAWDMLSGRLAPELGGRPEHLDIVGANFYSDNQWTYRGGTIPLGNHGYRPLQDMLAENHARYGRPILIAETGAEGSARAAWLHYVADEVRAAIQAGVPVQGICLYPIMGYPGWVNGRHCNVGLFAGRDGAGRHEVEPNLADELLRQQSLLAGAGARPQRRVAGAE